MEHSPKFERLKEYYQLGVWNERKLRDAVVHNWITASEFEEITGQEYE